MAKKAPDLTPATQDWLNRLQAEGYRVTAPRRAVVEVIANSEFLLDPAAIYAQARLRYRRLGLVTVYRTLEKLEQLGLIQRVHHPDGCQTFIPAVRGHQHLLICQKCNRVQYFSGDGERMDRLMASVSEESAYVIKDHWLQLFGLCPECQRIAAA
jgi:Fe2+ or Zn2+ uptake regulation protein